MASNLAASRATASPRSPCRYFLPRFIGQAERRAWKPACISAEIERAIARAFKSAGQTAAP
jgi:hypothetical protein